MSSTTHTPGPWKYIYGKSTMLVSADESAVVCSVVRQPRETAPEVYNANARLIAAAPDLLAALRDLVSYAADCAAANDERPPCIANARAAIAKAVQS